MYQQSFCFSWKIRKKKTHTGQPNTLALFFHQRNSSDKFYWKYPEHEIQRKESTVNEISRSYFFLLNKVATGSAPVLCVKNNDDELREGFSGRTRRTRQSPWCNLESVGRTASNWLILVRCVSISISKRIYGSSLARIVLPGPVQRFNEPTCEPCWPSHPPPSLDPLAADFISRSRARTSLEFP